MDCAALLSRFCSRWRETEDLLADLAMVIQVRPTATELYHDPSRCLSHACRHFDQPHAPRAGLALAQRIGSAALIEESSAGIPGQSLAGQFSGRILRRWIGHVVA
jgi:hypothetical protein